jgi:hypothetical protein
MSTERNNNKSVTESLKETAGSAFHTVHSALETTENIAMNAVDATTKAVNNLTDKVKNNDRDNR